MRRRSFVQVEFSLKKKGEQGWFGNKQTALYHSCKGVKLISTKGCFRFHKGGWLFTTSYQRCLRLNGKKRKEDKSTFHLSGGFQLITE